MTILLKEDESGRKTSNLDTHTEELLKKNQCACVAGKISQSTFDSKEKINYVTELDSGKMKSKNFNIIRSNEDCSSIEWKSK